MNDAGRRRTPFLFAVDFEMTEGIFLDDPAAQHELLFRVPAGSNIPKTKVPAERGTFEASPEPYEVYLSRFDVVMQGLQRGDSFLANLTLRTPLALSVPLQEVILHSDAPYCLYVPGRFACFSPERFVRIADGRISTNPMKGTIDASIPDAAQAILADPKETAEHYTVVDLLRNDLGMVAERVEVKRFRYIDTLRTNRGDILQVSSEIVGTLPEDSFSRMGDILFRMLPAGSVSGAPKRSTLELIRRAEERPRGFYTGVFGYFDGRELDSAVMIRYIEQTDGGMCFRSGGGITVMSRPEEEYDEVLKKSICHSYDDLQRSHKARAGTIAQPCLSSGSGRPHGRTFFRDVSEPLRFAEFNPRRGTAGVVQVPGRIWPRHREGRVHSLCTATDRKVGVIRDDAIDYSYKYTDRSRLNILLRDSGCDEIVIVRRGLVTDASAFNLVFESADGLFTPAGPLLAGTKRQELLERGLIAARRIEAQELGDYLNVRFINAMTDLKEAPKVATAALVRL